jgi:hypothetical protein
MSGVRFLGAIGCAAVLIACSSSPKSSGAASTRPPPSSSEPELAPVGDWQLMQQGQTAGQSWSLYQTNANNGVCQSLDTQPSQDAATSTKYRGREYSCSEVAQQPELLRSVWASYSQDAAQSSMAGLARADVSAITGVLDNNDRVAGSVQNGTFVLLWPTARSLLRIEGATPSGPISCPTGADTAGAQPGEPTAQLSLLCKPGR